MLFSNNFDMSRVADTSQSAIPSSYPMSTAEHRAGSASPLMSAAANLLHSTVLARLAPGSPGCGKRVWETMSGTIDVIVDASASAADWPLHTPTERPR